MAKWYVSSILLIIMHSCSVSNIGNNAIRYFDENNLEISKSKFNRIRSSNKLLDIPGDSAHFRRLIFREKRGNITNKAKLLTLLEKASNQQIDSLRPLVIIFHHGKDPCNISQTSNKEWITNWWKELEEGLIQIAHVKPLYFYKNNDGLEKYNGILNWYKDPEGTIERLFFKYHFPCNSFVVISIDGEYISYFGEFEKEYVWEAAQIMSK